MLDLYNIQLFLDTRITTPTGQQGYLDWWLYNGSSETIGAVQLDLRQSSPNSNIDARPLEQENLALQPGGWRKCSTACTVHAAGRQSLGVRLRLTMGTGNVVEHATAQEVAFTFPETSAGTNLKIRVEGSGLVSGPLPAGTSELTVGGDALLRFPLVEEPSQARPTAVHHSEHPDRAHLIELRLEPTVMDGISPINFEKFSAHWKRNGRPFMRELAFVDERGLALAGHAKVRDLYQARLQSWVKGHLTVIARGTSGKYMLCAPNAHSHTSELHANQPLSMPGELLPLPLPGLDLPCLVFADAGVEQLLALVTPMPLLSAVPLFDLSGPKPAINYFPKEAVTKVMQQACVYPGTEIGYVSVEVRS